MSTSRFYRIVWLSLAFLLYWAYPYLGFSLYAVASALVLGAYLLAFYLRRNEVDPFPYWVILMTLSLMVTTHYLRPRDGEYTNTDSQVFALMGVEQSDSLILLNPEGTGLWPVASKGRVVIADGKLHLHQVVDVPVYDGDSLLNASQMPTFNETVQFEGVTIRFTRKEPTLLARIFQDENDSLLVDVSFSATGNTYRPAFHRPLRKGYNFFDLLHQGVDYQFDDEQKLAHLRDVLVLRYGEGYALTYGEGIDSVTLSVDHQPYHDAKTVKEITLNSNNALYMGLRNSDTHPLHFSTNGNIITGDYVYPYLYRLPGGIGENKRLLLTSMQERLASSSISEVLFFDHLKEESAYGMNGTLSYQVQEAGKPFTYTIYSECSSSIPGTLASANGSLWRIRITDTRYESALTAKPVLWLHPYTLIGLIFLLYVLIFVAAEQRGGYAGNIGLFTGCVLLVFVCMAMFVTWRIAVFSPVDHISLAVLRRLTLLHSWYNPILGYLAVVILYAGLLWVGPHLCNYMPKGTKAVWGCAAGILLSALIGDMADNSTLCIALSVSFFVLGFFIASRAALSRRWFIGLWCVLELALFWSDPGYCYIFTFVSVFYLVFSSSWSALKKACLLVATVALAFGSAQVFIWIFNPNMAGTLLESKRHFYYRAAVQANLPIEQLMMDQSIDERDAVRALEASQNHWFIDYYNKQGAINRLDSRMFVKEPWHHTGVSYSTQISDQVCSRFLVGEISDAFPLCLGLVVLVFLSGCLMFRLETGSSQIAKWVGVIIFVQYLFVFLSCTNRVVFFGEDLPFISQTSKVMTLFFAGMMVLPTLHPEPEGGERNRLLLTTCLQYLAWIACIGGLVYLLSGNQEVSSDRAYNLHETIERAEQEIELINSKLRQSQLPSLPIQPNSDVSQVMEKLDEELALSEYINELFDRGRLSKFTFSLYRSFRRKLELRNNQNNIIHLRNRNSGGYVLGINKGFFYCADPRFEGGKFRSNIYGTGLQERNGIKLHKDKNFEWFLLPSGWSTADVALLEFNKSIMKGNCSLEGPDGVFHAPYTHLVMQKGELLIYEDAESEEHTFRYDSKAPSNLLVKHLNINGRSKFWFMNKHMWYRNLTDLLADNCVRSDNEPFQLTLDVELTRKVDSLMSRLGQRSSVVVLDQYGQVKLMTDYKGRGYHTLDPNDSEAVEEAKQYSYLNPNAEQERLLFANMNLMPMNPGPGSSIKPITLTSTMCEAPQFPWESLKMMSPCRYRENGSVEFAEQVIRVKKYGDHKYTDLYVLRGDEVGDGAWVDNQFFLSHSSNLYHGLILSLSSQEELPDRLEDRFKIAEPTDFPQFTVGKRTFSLNGLPEWNSNSLLIKGLYKNFGLPAYRSYLSRDTVFLKGVSTKYYPWVFPSPSYLLNEQLEDLAPNVRLRQLFLGSFPWHVTPIAMAEMYGRLFSQHPDFLASVIPIDTKPSKPWEGPDGPLEDGFARIQKSVIKGMGLAATEGTARWIGNELPKEYRYYVKTGTIGGFDASYLEKGFYRQANDRMIACVVSDKDVLKAKSPEDYRFWVIYIRMEKAVDNLALREILRIITESNSLREDLKCKLND